MIVTHGANAGETICEVAARKHVSMVVMGTRGMGVVRRTILGSVSDYVLHHAHSSVMICRQNDSEEGCN